MVLLLREHYSYKTTFIFVRFYLPYKMSLLNLQHNNLIYFIIIHDITIIKVNKKPE